MSYAVRYNEKFRSKLIPSQNKTIASDRLQCKLQFESIQRGGKFS